MFLKQSDLAYSLKFDTISHPARLLPFVGWVRVRASQISDVLKCRAINEFDDKLPSDFNAELGTIIHEKSSDFLEGKCKLSDFVDTKYVRFIERLIKRKKLSLFKFEAKLCSQLQHMIALTGSADFLGVAGDTAFIVDLKTGRHKVKHRKNKQLMTYALMLLNYVTHIKKFELTIFQHDKPHTFKCKLKDIKKFESEIKKITESVTYTVGKNCHNCFESAKCVVGSNYLRNLRETFMLSDPEDKKLMLNWVDNLHTLRYQLKRSLDNDEDLKKYRESK